nr:MAG TPA: hypothetical protein [Caudoviricetes sp.]
MISYIEFRFNLFKQKFNFFELLYLTLRRLYFIL